MRGRVPKYTTCCWSKRDSNHHSQVINIITERLSKPSHHGWYQKKNLLWTNSFHHMIIELRDILCSVPITTDFFGSDPIHSFNYLSFWYNNPRLKKLAAELYSPFLAHQNYFEEGEKNFSLFFSLMWSFVCLSLCLHFIHLLPSYLSFLPFISTFHFYLSFHIS